MWVFGYGSLVWKIDFPYEERVVGYIKGYTRKFWQASIDHRGTPEKPGVVVTLLKTGNPEDVVWGVAYRVHESVVGEGSALGQREIRYTERLWLPFYTKEKNLMEEKVLVFYGTNDVKLQLGPRPLSQMAAQIANAVGPSGSNSEYLFKLAKFLREQTPEGEGSEDRVWGVAYKIHEDKEEEVMSHLDYREKGGYTREDVTFYPKSHYQPWSLTIYVGTESNPFYMGPVEEDAIAEVISQAEGPSGKNKDYLFNLAEAMKELGVEDEHLINLYNKVARLTNS